MRTNKLLIILSICIILMQGFYCRSTVADTSSSSVNDIRISGNDRYQTAVEISENGWTTSDYVVLARGDDFADALCAGPLAQKYNGPILLTQSNALNPNTFAELQRLRAKHIIIVGGTGAVSPEVENELKTAGFNNIQRIFGSDRFQTSVMIARELNAGTKVALATGNDYPDALSISGIASKLGMPILLTGANSLDNNVLDYLWQHRGITQTYIIGGIGAISSAIEQIVPGPVRLSGQNRFETNIAVIRNFESIISFNKIYVATGNDFADALTGALLSAGSGSPLILVSKTLPISTSDYLKTKMTNASIVVLLGGGAAVNESVIKDIASIRNNIGKLPTGNSGNSGGGGRRGSTMYQVTFNTTPAFSEAQNMPAAQRVAAGGQAKSPSSAPTLAGYLFVDWYTDEELTTLFNFNTKITAATTIYAKFVPDFTGWSGTWNAMTSYFDDPELQEVFSQGAEVCSMSVEQLKTMYGALIGTDSASLVIDGNIIKFCSEKDGAGSAETITYTYVDEYTLVSDEELVWYEFEGSTDGEYKYLAITFPELQPL
ncbi:cell wall binding repeat 2-containing protein [Syntrophobotulus glycolicus DSM 8271]|uniref:Cell wall binding repeat 2-containing protein n=1 Tax=Syntrophobotulus glycolicus (strain DSM 8271 / FlGlyR) TaxID=645991 RepID=F0SWW4_SYNGF|nr:cell wall-binding repeat-containing protein [Syntrophobotulus glycolicus]ADY54654.1 cell wall binding repeat 2-containing protein [Syntrophobotulus glycolicus DSM 8271]